MAHKDPLIQPPKILVVEDEFVVAIDVRGLLIENGYEVIGPIATVRAALAELDRGLPDACVLDVNLRGEYSPPIAEVLNERGVPFLVSSAYPQDILDQFPAFAGAPTVPKPLVYDKLLRTLKMLLTP